MFGNAAVIADQSRQPGKVQRSRGSEADHRPVERDRQPRHAASPANRPLNQRIGNGDAAIQPVLGKDRFKDYFGRMPGDGGEDHLGKRFRSFGDMMPLAVALACEQFGTQSSRDRIPIPLPAEHMGRVGWREARDVHQTAGD